MTYNSKYIAVTFNQLPESEQDLLATAVQEGDTESAQRIIHGAFAKEHPHYDPAQANHALVHVFPVGGNAPWFTVSDRIRFSDFDPAQEGRVMAALQNPSPRNHLINYATSMADSAVGAFNWQVIA